MNKLFKLLVLALILEILLGYSIYLKDSFSVSGNYVSSTIKLINIISNIYKKSSAEHNNNYDKKEGESAELEKDRCLNYLDQNQHLNISGITSLRKPIDFQTNLEFLNSFDKNKHYLILIAGNSETFGVLQNPEERLHVMLQKKLRDKLKSKKIFIVNIGKMGGLMSDHLLEVLNFSEIYKPDLTIFYTGGNELKLKTIYEEIIIDRRAINNKNFKLYKFLPNAEHSIFQDRKTWRIHMNVCLNEDLYLTKKNFEFDNPILDIEKHTLLHFEKIRTNLVKNSSEFLFYIQPFNTKDISGNELEDVLNKIINTKHSDERFINLNHEKMSLDIDFVDLYHTRNVKAVSEKIHKDIIDKFEKNILRKVEK